LIIEEKIIDTENNRGIKPLPNLDFKFVIANSLLGLENKKQRTFFEDTNHIEQLKNIREEYFSATEERRIELILEFKKIQNLMFDTTLKHYQKAASERYSQLSSWNPFGNEPTSWFDPEWIFGIKNSFDIVIANPPYVESRSPNFSNKLKSDLQSQIKELYPSESYLIPQGADLLIYFFERALRFVAKKGIITFITSNGWLSNEYGFKFQKFLAKHTEVLAVIDTDYKYFENANINTIITFFKGNLSIDTPIMFTRLHIKFADVTIGVNVKTIPQEDATIMLQKSSNPLGLKWGVYFKADTMFFDLIKTLNNKGKLLSYAEFEIGQGLNISGRDNYLINNEGLKNFNIAINECIPFYDKNEAGIYSWKRSNTYLLNSQKIKTDKKNVLKKNDYLLFDISQTTKQAPVLIMPRGVAGKHYCTLNHIGGYSDSCVDIYTNSKDINNILRVWLFCNSSICWLIREIFGRKNLGGGMLKAEAVDLKDTPLFYKFNNMKEIKNIYDELINYSVKDCLEEICEEHHKKIDKIVFDYLELNNEIRTYIIDKLIELLEDRTQKSKRRT